MFKENANDETILLVIGGYTIANDKWEVKDTILVYLIKNNLIESFPIFEICMKFPRLCPLVCK